MERPQTRRGSSDTNSFWEQHQQQLEANTSQSGGDGAVISSSSRPLTRMVIFLMDIFTRNILLIKIILFR